MSPENDALHLGDASVATAPTSPGGMIRQGRERMNLSLDDLAGVTKLSYNTLEALERDDFAALQESVYVRGYYRKCAKVLDLPEKALLDAYQNRVAPRQPEPPTKLRLASGADLGSTSRLPVTLAIAAAIIAVIVCAIVWIARSGSGPAPVVMQGAAATDPAPATLPETAPVPAAEPVPPAAAAGAEAMPLPAAEPVATPPAMAPPPTPAAPAASTPATPAPAVAATPAATAAPDAAPAAPDSAVLSFTATSWVRVDDAKGKTIFNGLAQPGDSHVLTGALPLNVFLGNAQAVTVQFRGQPVDTQAFRRSNNTARFTLPPRS